jgi:hypothetical protein
MSAGVASLSTATGAGRLDLATVVVVWLVQRYPLDVMAREIGRANLMKNEANVSVIGGDISCPMHKYPDWRETRTKWGIGVLGSLFVKLTASDGTVGYATGFGGPPACFLIEEHFKRFVIGQDPRDTNYIWDCMWRASIFYGRKGERLRRWSHPSIDGEPYPCSDSSAPLNVFTSLYTELTNKVSLWLPSPWSTWPSGIFSARSEVSQCTR